jgi:hypothetical protein
MMMASCRKKEVLQQKKIVVIHPQTKNPFA